MPFDPKAQHAAAPLETGPSHVPASVEHLAVTIQHVLFANPDNGYFIAEASVDGEVHAPEGALRKDYNGNIVLIKGQSPSFAEHAKASIGHGLSVAGQWDEDARGRYFRVLFTQEAIPTSREALGKYLASGRLKGVGPSLGQKLMERFGLDLLRVLDHDPERLTEVPGITPDKAKTVSASWQAKRSQFQVVTFLGLHGIGETMSQRVADELGEADLEERIRANPYLLTEVDGIGFKRADEVALSLKFPQDSPLRIQAALLNVLQEQIQDQGNTAVPVGDWVQAAMGFVAQPQAVVEEHCRVLIKNRQVVLRKLPFEHVVNNAAQVMTIDCATPFRLGLKENAIAQAIVGRLRGEEPFDPEVTHKATAYLADPRLKLDPSQRDAALLIARSTVSILTGGPGTGKTTTLRSVVKAFEEAGLEVVLAAPTGRAAKRMEEAIGHEAATMHRTLEFKGDLGFQRNRQNPLAGEVFVLDETSMVDTALMEAWLNAMPPKARLVFAGDSDQLPSVGPGNVLHDFIASNRIPKARLTQVHRNGGLIAMAADRVRQGQAPRLDGDPWVDNFAFINADNDALMERVCNLIDGLINMGQDPRGIQVLVPRKDTSWGTLAFNDMLRSRLNVGPHRDWAATAMGKGYLEGDRVMQIRNDYKRGVFNGDIGHVVKVEEGGKELVVEIENGADTREVRYNKEEMRQLTMAYAQTVHKSQGGERPVIIMVCTMSHAFNLYRNILYTGITRGKDKVVVVGQPKAVALAAHKIDQSTRLTGLCMEIERVWRQLSQAKPTVERNVPRPR
jgi:exodeoxyribonuclease V alpha subunit